MTGIIEISLTESDSLFSRNWIQKTLVEEDEVIFFNCDLALGDTFREHVFNFAKHRRPEHYKLIIDRVGAGKPVTE